MGSSCPLGVKDGPQKSGFGRLLFVYNTSLGPIIVPHGVADEAELYLSFPQHASEMHQDGRRNVTFNSLRLNS